MHRSFQKTGSPFFGVSTMMRVRMVMQFLGPGRRIIWCYVRNWCLYRCIASLQRSMCHDTTLDSWCLDQLKCPRVAVTFEG